MVRRSLVRFFHMLVLLTTSSVTLALLLDYHLDMRPSRTRQVPVQAPRALASEGRYIAKKQLEKKIRVATSIEDLLSLYRKHASNFEEVHIRVAWEMIGKQSKQRKQTKKWKRSETFSSLVHTTRKFLARSSPRTISTVAHRAAKANIFPSKLFDAVAHAALERLGDFNSQDVANTVWAFATLNHPAPQLFDAVESEALKRLGDFNSQGVANTVWAFATMNHGAPGLFDAVAEKVVERLTDFDQRNLGQIVWAFATCSNALIFLNKISAAGATLDESLYEYAMAGVVSRGKLEEGLAILEESIVVSSVSYQMCATLQHAYRLVGDDAGANRIDSVLRQHKLKPPTVVASAIVLGQNQSFLNHCSAKLMDKSFRLCAQVARATTYTPQLQSLSYYVSKRTPNHLQERSLEGHAEKLALVALLECATSSRKFKLSVNLKVCADCHELFKGASELLCRRLVVHDPQTVHTFENGACSCGDLWDWKWRRKVAIGKPDEALRN